MLEIGPGPGGLTRALLLEGAAKVVAIERDERFRPILGQDEANQGRFSALYQDALHTDYQAVAADTGVSRVTANLPYNIATALIVHWLTAGGWPPWFDKLIVMVQREVAERLVAETGTPDYGRLAVLTQYRARPRILFTLPPKTCSCRLPRSTPPWSRSSRRHRQRMLLPVSLLEKVTAAQPPAPENAALQPCLLGADTAALIRDAGIDPAQRAERLTVADFVSLARQLGRQKG